MKKITAMATLCLCVLSVGNDVFAIGTGEVNVPVLNVRDGASTDNNIITKVKMGDKLDILSPVNGWYKVKKDATVGFVLGEHIDLTAYPGKVYNTDYVNVRDLPSIENGKVLKQIKANDDLKILYKENKFYCIELDQKEVYVYEDYVYTEFKQAIPNKKEVTKPKEDVITKVEVSKTDSDKVDKQKVEEETPKVEDVKIEETENNTTPIKEENNKPLNNVDISGDYSYMSLGSKTLDDITKELWHNMANTTDTSEVIGYGVALAGISHIGAPYVYGGTSFETGLDCSAFTQAIMKQHGIFIPRVSSDQANSGQSIANVGDIKPGDLVFFGVPGEAISHVGIYIGDNKMVHSGNENTGVTVDNIFRFGSKKLRYIKRFV